MIKENQFIPVKDYPNLVRDSHTGAIIAQPTFEKEVLQKKRLQNQLINERIDNLENSVNEINNNINLILELLKGK